MLLTLDGGELSDSRSGRITLGGSVPGTYIGVLVAPQSRSGHFGQEKGVLILP